MRFKVDGVAVAVFQRTRSVSTLSREAREKAGLSQTALANLLGSSQLLVSRSELGDRKVDVVELWAYCEALGLSFPDFAQKVDSALREVRPREVGAKPQTDEASAPDPTHARNDSDP